MANWDHGKNIGTHPVHSKDLATRLEARLDAAYRAKIRAERVYEQARRDMDNYIVEVSK